jgi:beta-galactosidase
VRLDNRDDAATGPKPLADLDFNMYGGLYRSVELVVKDPLHITDPHPRRSARRGAAYSCGQRLRAGSVPRWR